MSIANFIYNGNQTTVQCKENEILKQLFKKFLTKASIEGKEIIYLYNGNKIDDENKTVEQITKDKSFTILAFDVDNMPKDEKVITKSNEVICPECKGCAFLALKNYKLNLTCSQNGHSLNNILIKDFSKTQGIENDKIICNICKNNNKGNTYKNSFYRCCKCKKDICPTCKTTHDKNHKIINYDEKNYICNVHNELYVYYCKTCKTNICMLCESEHDKHEIINFGKILIKEDNIKKAMTDIRKEIDELKNKINDKISKLEKINENIEEYYNIINEIIKNYLKNNKRNYEIIKNINEIVDNNNIINDIKNLNNDDKFNEMIDIYYKINNINNNDDNNDNIIIYKVNNNNNKIKIFGYDFVENNKNNVKIEIEGKEYQLMEYYKINKNKSQLEIKIKGVENITNMRGMFKVCSTLSSLPDISKWNTSKVTNMGYMFCECSSLSSIPDISKWNTSNVTNMGYMFCGCSSLSNLPNISTWNTSNVTNMRNMFYKCSSLSSLPDISKWNINNVSYMKYMFDGCSSSLKIPEKFKKI